MPAKKLIWNAEKAVTAFGIYEVITEPSTDKDQFWLYALDGVKSGKQHFPTEAARSTVEKNCVRQLEGARATAA